MTIHYSIAEVLEIGVQIERNGRDFYREIIGISDDPDVDKIFTYLADQESNHITTFTKMLDSVKNYDQQESYPQEY